MFRCALPSLLLAAVLLWPAGAVRGTIPSPLCLGRQAAELAERLQEAQARLIAVLTARIKQKAEKIRSGKRFSHLPEDDREGEAIAQMIGSTAYADEVARANGGVGIGEKTAQEWKHAMLNDRVLDSDKTSLTDAAAGVGLLNARTGMKDQDMAVLIRNTQKGFTNTTFTDAGYTEAEWYADCKKALDKNPDLVVSPGAQTTLQRISSSSGAGDLFEMRAAAHMSDAESTYGKVLKIGADAEGGGFPNGSKVDIVTDKCLVQCGLTGGTVRNKLKDDLDGTVKGMLEGMNHAPNKRFVFAYSGDMPPAPNGESGPAYYAKEINKHLAKLKNDGLELPDPLQKFEASDFHSISFP